MPVHLSCRGGPVSTQAARLLLLAALAVATAIPCLAAEGFLADKMPPAVQTVWPSVYAFVCEGPAGAYTASAFLVKKTPRGKLADYTFITAGHAIEDCRFPRRYLVENINQPLFESDGLTVAKRPQRLDGVKLVSIDAAYDMAVVKVEASGALRIGNAIPVDDQCDRSLHREIYAVGFPGVTKRRSLHLGREVKRWSKGEYVGLGKADFRGVQSIYIASSVDSLPGNSGGPVVDDDGALVGVVVKGAANQDNDFRYDIDPKKLDDWQSFLVPCGAVLRFLQKAGLK